MTGSTSHWACVYPHGKPIWPRGNCFSGWFTLLLLMMTDGVQSGWFSNDAALLLDTMSCKGTMASPTIHWACV